MKRFSIVCALVLLLNVLCPVGHMHAEEVTTPSDLPCTHENHEWRYIDGDTCREYCSDCDEPTTEVWPHIVVCTSPGVCTHCGATEMTSYNVNHPGEIAYVVTDTTHKWDCPNCDLEDGDEYPHSADCDAEDTTVCTVCKATGVTTELVHEQGYIYDDTSCGWGCVLCKELLYGNEMHEHYEACDNPGVCDSCGQTGVTLAYTAHSSEREWKYDETSHVQICTRCNGEIEDTRSAHIVECTNPGVCSVCGMTGLEDSPSHGTVKWVDNGGVCEYTCLDCSTVFLDGAHFISCAGPADACYLCGIGMSGPVEHNFNYLFENLGDTHRVSCENCGEVLETNPHWVDCTNPGVCVGCGATGLGDEFISHELVAENSSSTAHSWNCINCGTFIEEENHYAACTTPDVCMECGATGVTMDYLHHMEVDPETWYYGENTHWVLCLACGGRTWEFSHWEDCATADGKCDVCGVECNAVSHTASDGYVYDSEGHGYTCADCGETFDKEPHYYDCGDPNTCYNCGYVTTGAHLIVHWWVDAWTARDEYHAKVCRGCGEEYTIAEHTVSCKDPGVCTVCGKTGLSLNDVNHGSIEYQHDDTHHWGTCKDCGETVEKGLHWTDCSKPNLCQDCGAEGVTISPDILSHFQVDWNNYVTNDTHHWYECACGEKSFYAEHTEYCYQPGYCRSCGKVGSFGVEHPALSADLSSDADNHWNVCVKCDGAVNKTAHADEDGDTKCDACGTVCAVKECEHQWAESAKTEATCVAEGKIKYTCSLCGESKDETIPATGKHTWGAPVTVDATCVAAGSKTTACTVCGEKTVENIPATGKHTWETVNKVYATCTRAGRTERVCAVCDELSITTQGAKGHSYGLVFVTEGNGTHAKTCADCGNKYTENCTMTSTEMGDMTCSACAVCGYAVYTMSDVALETVEGATDAAAQIEVKRVENVSFEIVAEPAEEGTETEAEAEAEPAETADVILVVHETELEMTVELPEVVNANVKKVLAVNLLKEGNSIQPSSKLKLSIPVVEEEVSGMKLVLMGENGELVEIEYEIIDGVIVFETDMVGIFLFVDAEA